VDIGDGGERVAMVMGVFGAANAAGRQAEQNNQNG